MDEKGQTVAGQNWLIDYSVWNLTLRKAINAEEEAAFMLSAQLSGIHSRSEKLIQATRDYERNRIGEKALKDALNADADQVIGLQAKLQFSAISDGMFLWQDAFRPLAEKLSGVRVGALTRFFDNNTFYRKPMVFGELSAELDFLASYLLVDRIAQASAWKVVLPGPYSFAMLVEDRFYKDLGKLMSAYAKIIEEAIRSLGRRGCREVQFDEPALVHQRRQDGGKAEEFSLLARVLREATTPTGFVYTLHTYFGDAAPIYPRLLDLPVDRIGFDLVQTNLEELRGYRTKRIFLGTVDSRNSLVERPEDLVRYVARVAEALGAEEIVLAPNTGLEYVPQKVAVRKMNSIGRAVEILRRRGYG